MISDFDAVRIRTGARLHFGPFALAGEAGRFGGLGLMIATPGWDLTLTRSKTDSFDFSGNGRMTSDLEALADRVRDVLSALRQHDAAFAASRIAVRFDAAVPPHAGLGSGTQLALAIAAGVDRLLVRHSPIEQLASLSGRGRRSAVGIHGFERGGFLVDSGKSGPESIGVLGHRIAFPEEWPLLLWTPHDREGLSGSEERLAFARLPSMVPALTAQLQSLVEDRLVPALHAADWREFSHALWDYGCSVGEHFAPVQGSVFSHPRAGEVIEWLRSRGIPGAAQSSWGPTIAAVIPDARTAEDLQRQWPFPAEELLLTKALNHGAELQPVRGGTLPAS